MSITNIVNRQRTYTGSCARLRVTTMIAKAKYILLVSALPYEMSQCKDLRHDTKFDILGSGMRMSFSQVYYACQL